MENQNNVLMEADHVKVYFKGKDKNQVRSRLWMM